MLIERPEPKRLSNLEKHGFDFNALTLGFFESAVILPGHSGRFRAVNRLDDRLLVVVFRFLGNEALTVISMRPASSKERKAHDQIR